MKAILPQVYPQVRLPIYAVMAFSLSVVDVALILGPANPPTLAVLAVRWFADADIGFYFPAAAAATLLLLRSSPWWLHGYAGERVLAPLGRRWIARGARGASSAAAAGAATAAFDGGVRAVGLLRSSEWRCGRLPRSGAFPLRCPRDGRSTLDAASGWPGRAGRPYAGDRHRRHRHCAGAGARLPGERKSRPSARPARARCGSSTCPLLVPQVAFLFGAQVLLVRAHFDGTLAAVVWAHLCSCCLISSCRWRTRGAALDPRYARTAASLGAIAGTRILRRQAAAACCDRC